MKRLGDLYVRAEFRAHKNAQPQHLTSFFQEWEGYLSQLHVTARARESLSAAGGDGSVGEQVFAFGSDLPPDAELSEQQIQQLQKLREEAEKLGK